ncbi:hypothetical protein E4T66_01660 [Sinimarinibacterium sp. CAU 1509]|uniref:hypothetical protein n=1 Tax=Sinimarinibacterium sp. CAU 1509 TaxID=2562283 RepID=UPI0010ABA4F6|nr:hypothetical protein [Sinimarinibacterium sp. CAU 1509]TJY64958.1 hypothetical protein E4T66_01660 [Sinimarinibacterium sp. CAU 1509]
MRVAQPTRVRVVATFDLIVTLPMAVPGLADVYVAGLLSGFGWFGDPAEGLPMPQTASIFIVLAGILAVLWNGCRAAYPVFAPMVIGDIAGRIAVAAAFLFFLLCAQAPLVLGAFVVTELVGAVIEASALRKNR